MNGPKSYIAVFAVFLNNAVEPAKRLTHPQPPGAAKALGPFALCAAYKS